MPEMTGGEVVAEYLIKEGVPYIFGVPGHGNMGFLAAVRDRRDKIKAVLTRHEQIAAFMADGYYRVAHQPVATFSSCGPGSINVLIGVAEAMSNSVPFLAITGDVPTTQTNAGALQETFFHQGADFPQVIRGFCKRSFPVPRVDRMPSIMGQAFKTMLTGRPGPVNIDVPYDLWMEKAEVEIPEPREWAHNIETRIPGNPETVRKALDLLASVEKPLILAGGGVILSEGWDELRTLSEALNIPVYTTLLGKGAMPETHEKCLGVAGAFGVFPAVEAARSADVILALGARFSDIHASSWAPGYTYNIPPTKLIQVDIDPAEIGRNYPVEIGIIADAKTVLGQMVEMAKDRPKKQYADWFAQLGKAREEWAAWIKGKCESDEVPIAVQRQLTDMRDVLPDDAIVTGDAGNAAAWVGQYFTTVQPKTHHQPGGFSSMGWGPSSILGCKLAAPDKVCVAVIGDGAFMMTPQVVATAVEYDIPCVWIIHNNYTLGAISWLQEEVFTGELAAYFQIHGTGERWNPDFAKLAEACGGLGKTIVKPEEFKPALETAIRSNRPYVLDVIVEPEGGCPTCGGWQMPPSPILEPVFGKPKLKT
jgi:acetolactate synthase-1/2/3 large subunit